MVILAELSLGQTVIAGFFDALFTAVLVGFAATFVVRIFERRAERRRREAESQEEKRRQEAEDREENRRQEAARLHNERLQSREFEYQTRAALRETYAQFLIAQRRSREASLTLAKSGGAPGNESMEEQAGKAYDEFIDLYHRLNLDVTREMWLDARKLRKILEDMLKYARQGNAQECEQLKDVARHARQNLENTFRSRLRYEPFDPLQPRKSLGSYDQKVK